MLFVQRDNAAPVAVAEGRSPPLRTSFIASAFAGQADAEENGKIARIRGDMAGIRPSDPTLCRLQVILLPAQSIESVGSKESRLLQRGMVRCLFILAPKRNLPILVNPRQGPGIGGRKPAMNDRQRQNQ